jgi:hypothetical protein
LTNDFALAIVFLRLLSVGMNPVYATDEHQTSASIRLAGTDYLGRHQSRLDRCDFADHQLRLGIPGFSSPVGDDPPTKSF